MYIKTKVFPASPRDYVDQRADDHFYIYTTMAAKKGYATKHAKQLLAEALCVPVDKLRLLRGHTAQNKLFQLLP
jgi:uncharacterized protein YggU (UPF0235/DUF167 family)